MWGNKNSWPHLKQQPVQWPNNKKYTIKPFPSSVGISGICTYHFTYSTHVSNDKAYETDKMNHLACVLGTLSKQKHF